MCIFHLRRHHREAALAQLWGHRMQEVRSQTELTRWDIKQAVAESMSIKKQKTCAQVRACLLASFYKEEGCVRDFFINYIKAWS